MLPKRKYGLLYLLKHLLIPRTAWQGMNIGLNYSIVLCKYYLKLLGTLIVLPILPGIYFLEVNIIQISLADVGSDKLVKYWYCLIPYQNSDVIGLNIGYKVQNKSDLKCVIQLLIRAMTYKKYECILIDSIIWETFYAISKTSHIFKKTSPH